jgi:hypothetical protein
MEKLVMHYLLEGGSGTCLRKLNKAFHDVLQYIDRIYFPEEYEFEKQAPKKMRSSDIKDTSKKVIL